MISNQNQSNLTINDDCVTLAELSATACYMRQTACDLTSNLELVHRLIDCSARIDTFVEMVSAGVSTIEGEISALNQLMGAIPTGFVHEEPEVAQ